MRYAAAKLMVADIAMSHDDAKFAIPKIAISDRFEYSILDV